MSQDSAQIKIRTTCRVCNQPNIIPILSLGEHYFSDFVDSTDVKGVKIPLELVLCDVNFGGCGLLQLKHTTPPELMYKQYWYKSGINQTMRDALSDITAKAESLIKLSQGDIVLDIGSNDSTLLRAYKPKNIILAGFEPATNLMEEARVGVNVIINDFFKQSGFMKEFGDKKAKIITAIAMFYDLDDPNTFVAEVANCLDKYGVFIIQQNYLCSMLKQNAFDNISHEHLEYYSLMSLENLLKRHNLEIFDVELNDINGGSFRTYIRHKDCELIKPFPGAKNRLEKLENEERILGLGNKKVYQEFAKRMNELKEKTYNFIKKEVEKGKKVYVYGACYDVKTRAVTTEGFKFFDELKEGDEVITVNPSTKEIEIKPIKNIIIQSYKGPMIHFMGKRVDLLVTPEHRILLEKFNSRKKLLFEVASKTAKRSYFKLPRGVWSAKDNDTIQISKFIDQNKLNKNANRIHSEIPTRTFLYLLGLYIGDGYLDRHSQGFSIGFCIPKKDKARKKLEVLLNNLGISCWSNNNEVHVSSAALFQIFSDCGKGAHNKKIPRWALEYSSSELWYLLRGLIDSDGWVEKTGNRIKYRTVSERLVKDIIELCFKLQLQPTVTPHHQVSSINGRKIESSDFIINIGRTQPTVYTSKTEQYEGIVWCISVDNENFLVQRNGKITFCGNSTRGNTLLQYYGIDYKLLTAAAERNPAKWGKKTIGTWIPIISEEQARLEKPDYFLILPWAFLKEFREREKEFLKSGGKFIVPLPNFEIVSS